MFNEDLLTQYKELQYKELQFKGQHMKPALPLDIINEKEEYKVEKVQNHRKQGHSTQFLVQWKGYGNGHDQ